MVVHQRHQRSDFVIQGDGCILSVTWATRLLSKDIRENIPNAELLVVCGWKTPSRNLKYLPALRGVLLATAGGWEGPLGAWSSGNFGLSVAIIKKERKLKNRFICGVSTNLPEAKRQLLEREGIELITEVELREALGPAATGSTLELFDLYARLKGIRVVDQYDCDWNWAGYVPIPEQIFNQIGPVSVFAVTPGTKGKYNGVGMPLRQYYGDTAIVLVWPADGLFPGGRNRTTINDVKNKFLIKPTAEIDVTEEAAYRRAGLHCPAVIGGVTYGAEVEGYEMFLRQEYDNGRIKNLELADGSIVGLVVASDSIIPYIGEGMKKAPDIYRPLQALLG